MLNKNLDNYTWVSIPSLPTRDFNLILEQICISRYATGGVSNANKSIKDIIGDGSFWDKFVFYEGKWRLGGKTEQCLPEMEIATVHMFSPYVDISTL